jgi:hypothetical protein
MYTSLFADVTSGMADKVAAYAIRGLAVGGGFLLGYALGKGVAWALDRWVFAHKAPDQLKKACALLSGVAVAVLVALVLFGEGGNGLFGGGGTGDGKGSPDQKGKADPTRADRTKDDSVPQPKPVDPVTPPKPADAVIRVTVLGGSDVPGYLLDDETKPKTFAELKDAVAARKAKEQGALGLALYFRPTNAPSLDPPHYSIGQLTRWAGDTAKLAVTFAAPK